MLPLTSSHSDTWRYEGVGCVRIEDVTDRGKWVRKLDHRAERRCLDRRRTLRRPLKWEDYHICKLNSRRNLMDRLVYGRALGKRPMTTSGFYFTQPDNLTAFDSGCGCSGSPRAESPVFPFAIHHPSFLFANHSSINALVSRQPTITPIH